MKRLLAILVLFAFAFQSLYAASPRGYYDDPRMERPVKKVKKKKRSKKSTVRGNKRLKKSYRHKSYRKRAPRKRIKRHPSSRSREQRPVRRAPVERRAPAPAPAEERAVPAPQRMDAAPAPRPGPAARQPAYAPVPEAPGYAAPGEGEAAAPKPPMARNARYYAGLVIGPGSVSRTSKVTASKTAATALDGTAIDQGSTYSFDHTVDYTRMDLVLGKQTANHGNFYEISFSPNDVATEFRGMYAFTFPSLTENLMKSIVPYAELHGGIGYYEADGFMPNNYHVGGGVGAYWQPGDAYRVIAGFDYTMRMWQDIDQAYGTESYDDTETRLYLGGHYFFDMEQAPGTGWVKKLKFW